METAVRKLFYVRLSLKYQPNDSSHLQKNLSKYGLKWEDISTNINLKL
jgi:sigma54-dependent transcription regulator